VGLNLNELSAKFIILNNDENIDSGWLFAYSTRRRRRYIRDE
jgi:hypothetical protein